MRRFVALTALLASFAGAWGQSEQSVAFAGHVLFNVWNGAGSMSQQDRIKTYDHRLVAVLGQIYLKPSDVRIRKVGSVREIWVGDHIMATATREDARTYGWSVDHVAAHWRNRIAANVGPVHLLPKQVLNTRAAWVYEIQRDVWPGSAAASSH